MATNSNNGNHGGGNGGPSRPTVQIRAVVVLNDRGEWGVSGGNTLADADAVADAVVDMHEGRNERVWILKADLPVPEGVVEVRPNIIVQVRKGG